MYRENAMNKNLAIISVYDKTNLKTLALKLVKDHNYEIISTGNTRNYLEEAGISTIKLSDYTGFPEILDGRVKSLHPRIHGGILADRSNDQHLKTLKEHDIKPVKLVICNLYPFEKVAASENATIEELVENIDIGGPTLIRSAAKNFKNVTVACSPEDYDLILQEIQTNNGETTQETREKLAIKAFRHTSNYDKHIYQTLASKFSPDKTQEEMNINLTKIKDLRYGENPHQKAALYINTENETRDLPYHVIQGKELSYNNLLDITAAIKIISEFDSSPAVCIIKHTNPCGVALGKTILEAYKKALNADPISAFGGIVGLNQTVDGDTAQLLTTIFLEVIVAPAFTQEAKSILATKKNLRLIEASDYSSLLNTYVLKQVAGGILLQDADTKTITKDDFETITEKKPSPAELDDLLFAWKIAKHVSSNAIVIAKNCQTLGIGCGQTSRIGAMEIALRQACDEAKDAVLASDGFFPAIDNIQAAAQSRISAIIQPGGSIKDKEVINTVNSLNMSMVFTKVRHFRH
jgi:phosphoribosylaminoimidazolecarboxamide formyltransferase / IMP cyclohydrolase